jgi:3-oxoacyl-[acyl-carrier protein] reductase
MKNRICIITGAARGIGLGIAQALAKRGNEVVLADILFNDRQCRSTTEAAIGGNALLVDADITSVNQVERLIADVVKRSGRIDCLVNAVGINRPCPIQDTTGADWNAVLSVNLTGAFLLSRAVAKQMIKQKYGRIIHVGSTASHTSAAGLAAYSASKHGLIGLVRGMACDLAQYGITVNAVCPGNNETEMLDAVMAARAKLQGRSPEEVRRDIISKTPAGRLGKPGDVAAAVLFLTSDEAGYITGQSLTVDGGRSLNLI